MTNNNFRVPYNQPFQNDCHKVIQNNVDTKKVVIFTKNYRHVNIILNSSRKSFKGHRPSLYDRYFEKVDYIVITFLKGIRVIVPLYAKKE